MAGQKATLWSNEEVQNVLCIVAEEKIKRQLDQQIQNENMYHEDAEMKLKKLKNHYLFLYSTFKGRQVSSAEQKTQQLNY